MSEFTCCFAATLDDMTILEQISPDTIVFLQTHKRIWPASQRDALFWSHMRHVTTDIDQDAHDEWMVCNHSVEHEDYPVSESPKNLINVLRFESKSFSLFLFIYSLLTLVNVFGYF